MSTHGLSIQILNSVKNSSKRKETVDRKKKEKKRLSKTEHRRDEKAFCSHTWCQLCSTPRLQGLEIEVRVSEQRIWSFSSGLPCLIEFNLSLLQIASPVAYQPAAFSAQHALPSGQGRRRAPAAAHIFSCCWNFQDFQLLQMTAALQLSTPRN